MFTAPSVAARSLQQRLDEFFAEHIEPNDAVYAAQLAENRRRGQPFAPIPLVAALQTRARQAGLWNLFLPHGAHGGAALTNLEYAPLCEIMGRIPWSAEVFNCSAPDTGNMEILALYGTPEQQQQWLEPLLAGRIRSAFLMSEPGTGRRARRLR